MRSFLLFIMVIALIVSTLASSKFEALQDVDDGIGGGFGASTSSDGTESSSGASTDSSGGTAGYGAGASGSSAGGEGVTGDDF